jgi:hypothetical protein
MGTVVERVGTRSVAGKSVRFTDAGETREPVWGLGVALGRLTCFFGIIVILAFVSNALITAGLRRVKTSSYGAWNQMMQGKVNADVLISGSSRAEYHYDPRTIEATTGLSAFNLGRNGSQTDVEFAVLKTYLEHNRKPRLIVHNLDAFTFVSSRDVYDPALYVPYLRDPELYPTLRQINHDFVKSRYVPLYGYVVQDINFSWVMGFKALLGWSPPQDHFLGFSPRAKQWTDDFQNFRTNNPNGVNFAIERRGVEVLEQLIQLCKANGIKLVFVYSPEYSEMQSLETNRGHIFGEFQRLATRYGVPIWDYSKWKYAGDTAYFYNSQHLNERGAAVFSADLASRLQQYLMVQPGLANGLEAADQPRPTAAPQ